MRHTLTLRDVHHEELLAQLMPDDGHERVAYVLCGRSDVARDPWDSEAERRYLSREVIAIDPAHVLSTSEAHVHAKTETFARLLRRAQDESLTVAVVHSHPAGYLEFSTIDDENEPALIELAQNRNGSATEVVSVVLERSGRMFGRVWKNVSETAALDLVRVIGSRLQLDFKGRGEGETPETLARQALAFGQALNADVQQLRVGIIGCGATGSATAQLLARLGVKRILAIDADVVEKTNLNRLHGSTMQDVRDQTPKIDVVTRELDRIDVGVRVAGRKDWVGSPELRDALKSCDIIFGCTDDNDGRLLLNRFAYFYLIPVIDMGFQVDVDDKSPPRILEAAGRVTVLQPGRRCLLCRQIINLKDAHDDQLERLNLNEFRRRQAEQYVRGGDRRDPSVVTFTTDVACMAVDELIHQLTGYRSIGSVAHRVRKYALGEDKKPGVGQERPCSICVTTEHWGRGDVEPFLDRVG
jgi:proteasome lid subunit RPN8/RPN11